MKPEKLVWKCWGTENRY